MCKEKWSRSRQWLLFGNITVKWKLKLKIHANKAGSRDSMKTNRKQVQQIFARKRILLEENQSEKNLKLT